MKLMKGLLAALKNLVAEKTGFNFISNTDSMWDRAAGKRKNHDQEHPMVKMGIDDPNPERIVEPSLSVLDIAADVMQKTADEGEDEDEKE